MTQHDVYLFSCHEPYADPRYPVPINGLIVHALTLLHRDVPQPDGAMIYRCLTEFPGRRAGEIVPLSTLTFELDGGRLWPQVADWEAVTHALALLSVAGHCDSMPLGLPEVAAALLVMGPTTEHIVDNPDGSTAGLGPEHRQAELDTLGEHLRGFLSEGPFWPGDDLVLAVSGGAALPYQPYRLPIPMVINRGS